MTNFQMKDAGGSRNDPLNADEDTLNLSSLSSTTEPYSVPCHLPPASTSARDNGDIIDSQLLLASTPSRDNGDVVTSQLQTAATPSRDASDIIPIQFLQGSTPATDRDTISSQFSTVPSTPVSSNISALPAISAVSSHSQAEQEQLKEVCCTIVSLDQLLVWKGSFLSNVRLLQL